MPYCCDIQKKNVLVFFASKRLFKVSSNNTFLHFQAPSRYGNKPTFWKLSLCQQAALSHRVALFCVITVDVTGGKSGSSAGDMSRSFPRETPASWSNRSGISEQLETVCSCLVFPVKAGGWAGRVAGGVTLYNAEKKKEKNEATRGLSDHIHAAARQKQKSEAANVGFHHLRVVCGRAQSALCRRRL